MFISLLDVITDIELIYVKRFIFSRCALCLYNACQLWTLSKYSKICLECVKKKCLDPKKTTLWQHDG